jgi:hypothetical protein
VASLLSSTPRKGCALRAAAALTLVLAVLSTAGASGDAGRTGASLPQGSEPVHLDPADFTTRIDNRYWPMRPGSRWVYREDTGDGGVQRVVVTVTHATKLIANGIRARVVHDVVRSGGEPVEVTDDWYAQDSRGNVWYLGERTAEYENGKVVSRAGSWEAGVDGAQPGVIMPARPRAGMAYRQEYYAGEAEDRAVVMGTAEQVEVPYGLFRGAVMTKELTPLEPDVVELKFYARGVGPVLTVEVSGGSGREELVKYARARSWGPRGAGAVGSTVDRARRGISGAL